MSNSVDVNALLQAAQDDDILSPQSMMAFNVGDIGMKIKAGLGVAVDDVEASSVLLLNFLIDDSGSIACATDAQGRRVDNSPEIRKGVNLVLDALLDSKAVDEVMVTIRYLSGKLIDSYVYLKTANKLDTGNYQANFGSTPLYQETAVVLGTAVAKTQDFSDSGVPCRSVTLIVTDGADNCSRGQTAASVAAVISDMLRTEQHIVMFMGIDDGGYTDFRQVARNMGIPDKWVLTPSSDPADIRRNFVVVSQSTQRVSQAGPGGMSQAAGAGFGT